MAPDIRDSGLTFWVVGPGWQRHCSAGPDWGPLEPGPDGLIAYLRSHPDLVVGEASEVTVGGLPATSVEVTTAASTSGCDRDGSVRLWKESGSEASISVGHTTRLVAPDVAGATVVFEIWGATPDT